MRRNGNRHRHVLCFFGVFQLFLRMLELAHNPVCMAEKDFSVLGEDDVSSGSAKQGTPNSCSSILMVWDRDGWEM